jgi:ubiquinol-cytochrome c reductase cytochrome b subunit
VSTLPPDQLLPDKQPAFVSSWIYVFGVAALSSFLFVLGSGLVLAIIGPQWFHLSIVGRFVNSLHLWSVELFFFTMVVHLWGKFFMAAWRGRRALTWMTGVVAFLGSILTALTGYLIQSNFQSQWIASQAKDGLDSVGIGSWINVLDYGQMVLLHVALLPLVLGVIVIAHILLVRRRGVVAPYASEDTQMPGEATPRSSRDTHIPSQNSHKPAEVAEAVRRVGVRS